MTTGDDAQLTRWETFVRNIGKFMPDLPVLGFAFWFAWNLIAFSGTLWTDAGMSSLSISIFFVAHLAVSALTHLVVCFAGERAVRYIMHSAWIYIGAIVGTLGTAMMLYVNIDTGSVLISSLFVLACTMAGFGTSLLFIRSATIYSTRSPRRSFAAIFLCALFAIAVYCVVDGYRDTVGPFLFALLPCMSAFCLVVKRYTSLELTFVNTVLPIPRQFKLLLLAIFIYSFAQDTTKSYLLTDMPVSQSAACMQYVMLGLMVLSVIMIGMELSIPQADMRFGRIYYPLALLFVVPQVALPAIYAEPLLPAIGIDFAGYAFDLLLWAMASFLAYRMQGNSILFICLCTASLSVGLALGTATGTLLLAAHISNMAFQAVNLALAVASIVMTIFVFPEHRLNEIFTPIEEEADEQEATHRAYWLEACDRVAAKGGLTEREKEVFIQIAKGQTAQQVADELVVSVHTVRAHVRKIHSKLEVSSRKEIIALIEGHMDKLDL